MSRRLTASLLFAFAFIAFASDFRPARAQEADQPDKAEQPAEEPQGVPDDEQRELPSLSNTSVSIPWNELRDLLGEGGGDRAEKPPVDFVFSTAAYTAEVGERAVSVSAEADVTLLGEGWVLVPLGAADSGV